ncbi:MAG: hypothetical protein A2511_11150 [Deltaproteobacteria bacterium RIFOXYD12_FULL_50_9]|nr:MAG: hypothetical protein A2511_11150 [Deltaproteobacteria bacterium RIFOXYD12_FULL_50_9]
MSHKEELYPEGEKMRMAVRWLCDVIKNDPEKKRADIIREAEIRFDLSPKECQFLDTKIACPECSKD